MRVFVVLSLLLVFCFSLFGADAQYWINKGNSASDNKVKIACYLKSLQYDKNNYELCEILGGLLEQEGDLARSIELYDDAIKILDEIDIAVPVMGKYKEYLPAEKQVEQPIEVVQPQVEMEMKDEEPVMEEPVRKEPESTQVIRRRDVHMPRPLYERVMQPLKHSYVIRSVCVPGLGQIYAGQKTKGYIIAGSTATTLLLSYLFDKKSDDKYDDYKAATNPTLIASLRSDVEDAEDKAKIFSYLTVGIWIYNVVDAYLISKNELALQSTKDSNIQITSSKDKPVQLAYQWRWK